MYYWLTASDGSSQIFVVRVGLAIFGLGLALENFPFKVPNFSIFCPSGKKISSGQVKKYLGKAGLASYLLLVKSMLGSGPISTKVLTTFECAFKLLIEQAIDPKWYITENN